jgi:hypothetical protein
MIRVWHMWKTSEAWSVLIAVLCVLTVSSGMEQQQWRRRRLQAAQGIP